jgi:HlyD family secretion protein
MGHWLGQHWLKGVGGIGVAIALGSVAIGLGWQPALSGPGPAEPETSAIPLPTVSAIGYLQPTGETLAIAPPPMMGGNRLGRLLVAEGDRVVAGQAIAILDHYDLKDAAFQKAQSQVQIAQAELARVQAGAKAGEIQAQTATIARIDAERTGDLAVQEATIARIAAERDGEIGSQQATIARLRAERDFAQAEADRYERLYQSGAIAASDRDAKHLNLVAAQERVQEAETVLRQLQQSYQERTVEAIATLQRTRQTKQEQLDEARATLDRIAEIRPTDLQAAEAQVAAAIAAAHEAKTERDRAIVTAPSAGRILKVHAQPGELIGNEGILDLGQTEQMEVLAEVYDSDIHRVQVGQPAQITSDAIATTLTGTVTQVGWQVQKQSIAELDPAANIDARVVEVTITLNAASSQQAQSLTGLQVITSINTTPRPPQ